MSEQNDSQLTLIEEFAEKTKTGWKGLYQCSCGNQKLIRNRDVRSGKTKSCGCLRKKKLSELYSADLTCQIFGYWKVLYRVEGKTGHGSIWHCQCTNCGNEKDIQYSNLVFGKSQSCGCLRKQLFSDDLTDQRFGKLVAKEILYNHPQLSPSEHSAVWRCECDCGNSFITSAHRLKSGSNTSCGCLTSKGESKIKEVLTALEINFIQQYSFEDLADTRPLKFDFYLPQQNVLIEFQGEQHYKVVSHWGGKEGLEDRLKKDSMKRSYCLEKGIKLIEIPYWDYDKITTEKFIKMFKIGEYI